MENGKRKEGFGNGRESDEMEEEEGSDMFHHKRGKGSSTSPSRGILKSSSNIRNVGPLKESHTERQYGRLLSQEETTQDSGETDGDMDSKRINMAQQVIKDEFSNIHLNSNAHKVRAAQQRWPNKPSISGVSLVVVLARDFQEEKKLRTTKVVVLARDFQEEKKLRTTKGDDADQKWNQHSQAMTLEWRIHPDLQLTEVSSLASSSSLGRETVGKHEAMTKQQKANYGQ
uniref:Uncharacterized protein n=1 Tax=Cucumis melo TaxID=3656 RepID=A0A9I9EEI7_CUCME